MASENIQRRGIEMMPFVFSFLFIFLSIQSFAQISCHDLLSTVPRHSLLNEKLIIAKMKRLQKYHEKNTFFKLETKDVDTYLSDIERMAESIIRHNYKKIYTNSQVPKNLNLRLVDDRILQSGYHLFVFSADGKSFQIRSNGKVAFLNESWRFRLKDQTQHYTMAYIKDGRIHNDQQTEFILSTFSDNFFLSRDMGRKERERWLNGQEFYADGMFGAKVHFGVHYFRFKDYQPYMIEFTRDELIQAYFRDGLEINSYDHIGNDRNYRLVPHQMDLELEVVFIGKNGIDFLKPKLKEALRQDVLGF